jgi:uncharacterized membrane protein YtjA (UPF0391 family)
MQMLQPVTHASNLEERSPEEATMLYWAVVFLVIAIIAALFGFGVIASAAAGIAKILFFIFLVVFVISLIFGLSRRGTSV